MFLPSPLSLIGYHLYRLTLSDIFLPFPACQALLNIILVESFVRALLNFKMRILETHVSFVYAYIDLE